MDDISGAPELLAKSLAFAWLATMAATAIAARRASLVVTA